MKETILLFNITDRNTKLKLERILLPLKLRIRRIPVSQYGQTLAALCGLEEPADLPSERNSRFEPQKHSNRLFLSLLIDLYNKYSISPFPSDQLNSSSSTYFSFE